MPQLPQVAIAISIAAQILTPIAPQSLSIRWSNFRFSIPEFRFERIKPTISPQRSSLQPSPTATPTYTPTPTMTPTPTRTPTPRPTKTPRPTATPKKVTTQVGTNYLEQINAYRAQHGKPSVQSDQHTCNFAQTRATEITSDFSHSGFQNRINSKSLPYPSYSLVTENIAMTSNPAEVVTMWINSPGHAANMLADTTFVCVKSTGNYYAYEGWTP